MLKEKCNSERDSTDARDGYSGLLNHIFGFLSHRQIENKHVAGILGNHGTLTKSTRKRKLECEDCADGPLEHHKSLATHDGT